MDMTIMDKINKIAESKGITPVTGSIVDCLNNITVALGGTPTGGTIEDAIRKYKEVSGTSAQSDDDWNFSIRRAPTIQDQIIGYNTFLVQDHISYSHTDDINKICVFRIETDPANLTATTLSESDETSHKWVALGLNTGFGTLYGIESDISGTMAAFTAEDVTKAQNAGLNTGEFLVYVPVDSIVNDPMDITLRYTLKNIDPYTIRIIQTQFSD